MPRFTIDIDPADVDTDGFGDAVTGASFTLLANDSGDSLAHQVSILNNTATDHRGKTVTLVGTDADGVAQTEVVTGPDDTSVVESALYFLTLTSATPSATIGADTFDIGWVDEVATRSFQMNTKTANNEALVQIDVSGTIDVTVQAMAGAFTATPRPWMNTTTAGLVTVSADVMGELEGGATAMRVIANSYSSGGEIQAYVSQAQ